MLSKGFKRATRYGARGYCAPVDHQTGNPTATCIPAPRWMTKYHYSRAELNTLLRRQQIKAIRTKGRIYIQDAQPLEGYDEGA